MMSPNSSFLPFVYVILVSCLWLTLANNHENFLVCLLHHTDNSTPLSEVIYTQANSSYASVLNFSIRNLRFSTPTTPKPLVIVTPTNISHIQETIICSKKYGMQIRVRSGGHDFEGLSYVSNFQFVVIDLINLSSINIDSDSKTAWVQSGATVGQLYYRIAEKSRTLAFPAGGISTVGVGGHFSGGGWGFLMRKYGLAADNILDAHLIDANGRYLDRETMGEDLFWAIRGGGGGSFGVVVSWKIKLVTVPSNVSFAVSTRTLEQNVTTILHRWQFIANKVSEDLMTIPILSRAISNSGGNITIQASFITLFLGRVDQLLLLMDESLPELGLVREECFEVSWIESAFLVSGFQIGQSLDLLLNRSSDTRTFFKSKSDNIIEPISKAALEGMVEKLYELDEGFATMFFLPYGGKMNQISESEIPFPHRAGNMYTIIYDVVWERERNSEATQRLISWVRNLYDYMTPYVSKNPRLAYVNYRDLDIGKNDEYFSIEQARIWGEKYFKNNFNRLVHVKTMVDPQNFFKYEQSIPPISSY